jgi:phosphoglycerate dehydrogenase-like enzyme
MPLNAYMPGTPYNNEAALDYMRGMLADDITLTVGDMPEAPQYELLIAGRPTEAQLSTSQHLHTLIIPFAGLPAVTQALMQDFPQIAVHNLHYNAPPTAEAALTLLLTVAKRTIPADRDFRRHDWTPRYAPYPQQQLRGRQALILGYGAVGRYLRPLLEALGMKVWGVRRQADPAEVAEGVYGIDRLHDLLPRTEALIIALPGTPQTENLIDGAALALLPPGAMLVNVGRAVVVDQYALYDRLQSGYLHGAGLDVWYNYPTSIAERTQTPPADVPLHELDNVVMSPHRAGGGGNADIERLRMASLAEVLNMAARGEPLPHKVNLTLGY